jgi:hypothetical protein
VPLGALKGKLARCSGANNKSLAAGNGLRVNRHWVPADAPK